MAGPQLVLERIRKTTSDSAAGPANLAAEVRPRDDSAS